MNRAFEGLRFEDDPRLLEHWLNGSTGFVYADAAMRRLRATGWLNFRSRAMLVSLAVHVLHLSWRTILYPLAKLMGDYLPGIHVSQTQMQAGMTGINTLRVYNPTKQLNDHDPHAVFVRAWIPELRNTDPAGILRPPVNPVADYTERTAQMKRMIYDVRRSPKGRAEAQRVLEVHGSRRRPG